MLGKWEQPWLRVGWNEPFNYFYVNGERAGITLAIPWDERFRGARVTLPRGWRWIWGRGWTWRIPRGAVYPSVGRASIAEKQMATCYFPPWREWCSRGWCTLFPSRRNLWQGLEGVEPPERIITKRYWGYSEQVWKVCFSISWEFAIWDNRDKNIDSLFVPLNGT